MCQPTSGSPVAVLKVKPRVTLGSVEELGRRPGAGAIFCAGPEKKDGKVFLKVTNMCIYIYIYRYLYPIYIYIHNYVYHIYISVCVCRYVFNYFR